MCVKSDAHSRPGVCFWPKYTSCPGPSVTRHRLIRRCSVRICPSLNRPGYSRCSQSNSVLASRPGLSSTVIMWLVTEPAWNFEQEPHDPTDETGVNLRAYLDRNPRRENAAVLACLERRRGRRLGRQLQRRRRADVKRSNEPEPDPSTGSRKTPRLPSLRPP